ncbi:MAG: DUF262 domain-containing HNH endonuclease family protein [Balneola sp.]|jgi:uncharacterized protein with ParB-like and HNH nuclease domain
MALGNYELRNISKVFTNTPKISVPFFQRPYSWRKTEQSQFLEDLFRVHEEKSTNYFIGSIFLKEDKDDDFTIIDGQQRITSATILISVIRDILKENNDERALKIESKFLFEEDLISGENNYKLNLNDLNRDFFREKIQNKEKASKKIEDFKTLKDLTDSNKLLIDCYKLYHKELKQWTKTKTHPENITNLLELLKTLTENFQTLSITVTDDNEAFTIFETLNDRGLDLTISDLLKNYLFSIIYNPNDETETRLLVTKWDSMVEKLGKSISGFFKHYWNSKNSPISEKQIFRTLKAKIKSEKQVKDFLKEIFKEADVYYYLLNPEHSYWSNEKIERLLREVSLLGMRQCLPVLLSAKFKFNEDEFTKTVESCVGLSFRYSTVSNLHNNKLEGLYSKVANSIRKLDYRTNSKVREQLKTLDPKQNIYDESFKNLTYKNNKTPRYILKKINDSLDDGQEVISSENITLEHIVPESPKTEHKDYFKKNNIIHKETVYKLYNMTILGEEYNRTASSELFEKKLEMYRKSKLEINKKVLGFSKWTKSEMTEWSEYLLKESKNVWKI